MHALVDLDIVCYEVANSKDDQGDPLDWGLVKWRVDDRIHRILEEAKASTWQGYLTGSGNFRDKVATIKPYKGPRRLKEKPFWYEQIREYLVSHRLALMIEGMEADDAIATEHTRWHTSGSTVICSRDKDFNQVPGYFYSWPGWKDDAGTLKEITPLDGIQFHYVQLLTGDSADNIPGLYGVGPSSSLVKQIHEMNDELEMLRLVVDQYEKRFGSYWYQFLVENGTLLWLLRSEDDNYERRLSQILHSL